MEMKLVAFGMLLVVGLLAADGAGAVDVVGEARAVECGTWITEELYLDPCAPICWAGERLGWHCLD